MRIFNAISFIKLQKTFKQTVNPFTAMLAADRKRETETERARQRQTHRQTETDRQRQRDREREYSESQFDVLGKC